MVDDVFCKGCIQGLPGRLMHKLLGLAGWDGYFYGELEVREAVTVSDIWIVSLAMLIASLLREMIDLEMGVTGVMATLRVPKLKEINGFGLTINTHVRFPFAGHFIDKPNWPIVEVYFQCPRC